MKELRVVFWDFDGVIKESVDVKSRAFQQLFADYGSDITDCIQRHHEANGGISRYQKIPLYLSWVGEPADDIRVQQFCDRFSQLVEEAVIHAPWVPGAREYLEAHHSRQRFILTTATPQREIERILQATGLSHCFREVHGLPITKQAVIADVLTRYKCAPEQALMVGDSEADLEAAEANHVVFLLRRTKFNTSLQQQYAGRAVDDLLNE